jgi:hypothetical protein
VVLSCLNGKHLHRPEQVVGTQALAHPAPRELSFETTTRAKSITAVTFQQHAFLDPSSDGWNHLNEPKMSATFHANHRSGSCGSRSALVAEHFLSLFDVRRKVGWPVTHTRCDAIRENVCCLWAKRCGVQ